MSMKKFCQAVVLLTMSLMIVVNTGCKKDDDDDKKVENTSYAEDAAMMEQAINDLDVIVLRALSHGPTSLNGGGNPISTCATIKIDTTGVLKVMTIDFGQKNCLSFDGRYRRGRLIVHYKGKASDSTHYRRVEPDFYYVNDNRITGTKEVSAKGVNGSKQLLYVSSFKGELFFADITYGSIKSEQTRYYTWTGGANTPQLVDDVYDITATGNLTRNAGDKFVVETLAPIKLSLDCNWIKEGVVRITPGGATRRSIDYGSGACDNKATLTVNGITRQVLLIL